MSGIRPSSFQRISPARRRSGRSRRVGQSLKGAAQQRRRAPAPKGRPGLLGTAGRRHGHGERSQPLGVMARHHRAPAGGQALALAGQTWQDPAPADQIKHEPGQLTQEAQRRSGRRAARSHGPGGGKVKEQLEGAAGVEPEHRHPPRRER